MTFPSNIRFAYLYRDAGNYKQYGEAIFSNESLLKVEDIDQKIRSFLSDNLFFIAQQVHIEERFFDVVNEDDHPWHEFVQVEATSNPTFDPVPGSKRDITHFLKELEQAHCTGWDEMQVREDLIRQIEKERETLECWLDSIPSDGEAPSNEDSKPVSDVKSQYGDEHEDPV